jgi:cytochrome c oxidase subunit 4
VINEPNNPVPDKADPVATSPQHVTPVHSYVALGIFLLILLAVTLLVASSKLGVIGTVIGLLIAATKATLVAVYFMHLNLASSVTRLAAAAGLFWLGIMIVLTLNDFLTRGL